MHCAPNSSTLTLCTSALYTPSHAPNPHPRPHRPRRPRHARCRAGHRVRSPHRPERGRPARTALAEFDGAICRSGVKITAESLEGNRRLRGHRAGRRGHRQHRQGSRHAAGHRRDEHAGRQHAQHGRAHLHADARPVAQRRPAYHSLLARQVGPQNVHGHAARRQNAGHRRPGPHRAGSRQAGPRLSDARARLTIRSCRPNRRPSSASSGSKQCATCCRTSITSPSTRR